MSDWPADSKPDGMPPPVPGPRRSMAAKTGSFLGRQLLGLAVCIGLPALVTAIAPVSWVRFERHEGRVTAQAHICLLFVVPYKTLNVDPVVGIGDRFVEGTVHRERRAGRDKEVKSEDEGFLVIQGEEQAAEVPVTPFNLDSVVERSTDFLEDPQATELKMFVVANWKFSVIAGGLISLLTVLYLVGIVCAAGLKVIHIVQWAMGVPPEQRLFAKQKKNSGLAGSQWSET